MKLIIVVLIAFSALSCGPPREASVGAIHPLMPRYPEEIEVTQLHGPLVVRPGSFFYRPELRDDGSGPWNTWYFPLADKYFFEPFGTGPGRFIPPLEKYDYYVRHLASPSLRNTESRAQQWESERYRSTGLAGSGAWMGYCHATAAAGILEPQPRKSLNLGSLTFTVGDLKALLIRVHENVEGARNFGSNFASDRDRRNYISQADLYPDQLLRLIQVELGDRGRSFYLDSNSSNQIWNEPVLWADIRYEADSANARRIVGHLTIATAKSNTTSIREEDRKGKATYEFLDESRLISFPETFTFELFGKFESDGSFHVDFGEWTELSRVFHPDFATVLPAGRTSHKSSNPHINPEVVAEIIARAAAQQ